MLRSKATMINKILLNNRLLAVFLLGFSSGLPLALTHSTLQAWFTEAGVSISAIGALSLLGIPYSIKFLWSPLMDTFKLPYLNKRLGWVFFTQFSVTIALLCLAAMDPHSQAGAMGAVALMVAFFAASQDIAIDAYRTVVLSPAERGLGVSYFVLAYRIAMLVAGGLALILADYIGWHWTYIAMAGMMAASMGITLFAPTVEEPSVQNNTIWLTIKESLADLLQHNGIYLILLFIVLYKLGDALALALMTNFLLKGLGFSLTEVGLAFKIFSPIAIILGGISGGVILLRWNLYRALILFGLAQAFSNLSFAALALMHKSFWWMSIAVCVENFCSGLSTAALLAFLMSLCSKQFSATQYALLSALSSFSRVFLGPLASFLVLALGWAQFFVWSFVLCFPSILLLFYLKEKVPAYAPATADS